ncbi:MAG: hydroxyphenylacetyl-CoA thioesterase PaaI [Gammaproteobacteria bacterium]
MSKTENSAPAPQAAAQHLAERTARAMYEGDAATRGLGIEIVEVRPGFIRATMLVRPEMVNGHGVCHGGYLFTFADSAFAFCCNSFNAVTVAAGATIDFVAPGYEGDRLTATATQLWRAGKTGLYDITVTNQHGAAVALFRGRSYQLKGQVVPDPENPPTGAGTGAPE